MAQEYNGGEIISITAEDGTAIELEHILTFEYNGSLYIACFPLSIGGQAVPEDSEDYGTVLLRIESENGEEYFAAPDTQEENEGAYEAFLQELYSEEGEPEEDD